MKYLMTEEEINKELGNPVGGLWERDFSYVGEPVTLQYGGFAVVLHPDGTYFLEDTTGG